MTRIGSGFSPSVVTSQTTELVTAIEAVNDGLATAELQWQPNLDAFARLRVSNPASLFDSKQLHEPDSLFWDDQQVSGSGTSSTYDTNSASSIMGVSASTAGRRVRQTFNRFNYQSGKSQLVMMTGCLRNTGGGAGITSRIGYFDESNGLYFQLADDVMSVVVRSNVTGTPVEISVPQTSWNIDKADGLGPSGMTLDITKMQLFFLDFEWLGAGTVRFGFFYEGDVAYVHAMNFGNVIHTPYMSTSNLPLRAELINSGDGAASTMRQVCSSVMSEGGQSQQGLRYSASTGNTHLNADAIGVTYALIGLSPRSDRLGIVVNRFETSVLNKTNDNFQWSLLLNPTVAGTFAYSNYGVSSIRAAFGVTANTVTGGTMLASGFSTSAGFFGAIVGDLVRFGSSITGTLDSLVLCVMPMTANADVVGSISWRELR